MAILIIFLGVFGGTLGYFFWTFALTHLTPTQVAVYVNVNPMVAIILGAVLLKEEITGMNTPAAIPPRSNFFPMRKLSRSSRQIL